MVNGIASFPAALSNNSTGTATLPKMILLSLVRLDFCQVPSLSLPPTAHQQRFFDGGSPI